MAAPALRILGIDPGLRVTGFGVIDKAGQKLAYVTSGCIRTPLAGSLPERLAVILDSLGEVIAAHRPGQVALEKVFVNVNPESTLALGQARGTAICAAVSARLPVAEYTALQVKQAVVGNGLAKKEQVQEMVKRLLHLAGAPSADAADALACAICHAHGGQGWRDRHRRLPGAARAAGGAGDRAMIGRIQGVLLEKNPPQIIVDCQGVGYEVEVPMSTFYNLPATGERVALLTHLLVREDAHLLYGFGTEGERRAFRQLLKISGVGARTSLAVLSGLSVAELAEAVTLQESGRLTRIPGIGKKTAERLLLELKDKLGVELTTTVAASRPAPATSDILRALLALGYSEKEAAAAVRQLPEGLSVSDGIRQALKSLSRA
jgi:Holliday junction DNA helicase RuvA